MESALTWVGSKYAVETYKIDMYAGHTIYVVALEWRPLSRQRLRSALHPAGLSLSSQEVARVNAWMEYSSHVCKYLEPKTTPARTSLNY